MLEAGQNINQFKIIKKLGEGGMGEVYLAEDQKLGRQAAIKILSSDFANDVERLERFRREATTAAKISHNNIMGIYDIGAFHAEDSKTELNYIVMEYIKGPSLKDYLSSKTLSISDTLKIAERIARGLAAAHKLDIVHRDIKAENIIINEDGEPKILDFGLAKPLGTLFSGEDTEQTVTASDDLTQEGKIVGTVTYMSPEQARGERIDARSDIFSFGILLYKMFTGEYPFDGGDRVSTIARILEVRHEPIRRKNAAIPAELERIIDKCLQKNPDDRYQDSRDLVVDLRALRRQYESGISDSTTMEMDAVKRTGRTRKPFFADWRVITSIAAIVVIIILISTLFTGHESDQGYALQARENALAILSFENKTGDSGLDWLESGLPEILITDLAQGGGSNIISRNRIDDYLRDKSGALSKSLGHREYVDAARSLGASTVLSGSYFKLGDKIRIDARLEDVETGKILLGEKVIGEDPFLLVDSLTQKIAQSLNVQELMAGNQNVADITSSSPEAYKQYILGMEYFGRNLFDSANVYFEKAIEIDSTFALPYMRIGVGYALRGRGQSGMPYFKKALQYESKLPVKDRSLLNIYADVWLNSNWDDASVKIKSFVANYPDDKEVRALYAIIMHELLRDSEGALAQLDTVLMLDPKFLLGLTWSIAIYRNLENYDKAIEYAERMKEYYPDNPLPYKTLAGINYDLSRHDETIAICKEIMEKFPDEASAPSTLMSTYILKRQFDSAAYYNDFIREHYAGDSYRLSAYYNYAANLAFWMGRFEKGLDYLKKSVEEALSTEDSMRISLSYLGISETYIAFHLEDSAVYYARKCGQWATMLMGLNYPLTLISISPKYEAQARPLAEENLAMLKAKLPAEMWPLADVIEDQINAYAKADTAAIIETYLRLINEFNQSGSGNHFVIGKLRILTGKYEDGIKMLDGIISGTDQTTDAIRYLKTIYYMGIANEALGKTQEAVKNYREFLKYWGTSEIELKEIKDARTRLNRLTS